MQIPCFCQEIFSVFLPIRTLVTLLSPRIKRFTMIIPAWGLQTSIKFSGQEFEEIHWNNGSSETLKQVRITPIIK